MKNKFLAYILMTIMFMSGQNVFANQEVSETAENMETPEIISQDIKDAVEQAKAKKRVKELRKRGEKPVLDTVFIDAQTAQSADGANVDAIREKTISELEQEPVIEAFGVQETDNKVLQATVQKIPVLALEDCIKMALENNPSIMSSIANTKIYHTKIGQAWSNFFPKVGVGIGYTRNKFLPLFFKPSISKYNSYTMPSIDAEWMIFDFGKTKAQVDIAKKTHQATEEDLQETVNTTIYNVKNAFYSLLFALQQEKVWQSSVEQYEISLEQAKAYYEIGTKPKIDVYTAEYNLSNAKLGHIKAQNEIHLAYAELNNAMGLPEYANYELAEELTLKKYDLKLDNLLEEAMEVRPGLMAAKKKAEASKHLVTASKRAFLPDLKLSGNFTQGGLTANSGEYGYALGGNLAYSMTNFALLKKQVDEANATADKDIADYEVTRQKVYLDVKQAYIQLKNAKENVPVSKNALIQAQEQFNLARGRYKVGMGDVIELKDAETTYRNAQLDYYKALLDYNISAANLERVVGVPITPDEEVAL